MTPLVGRIALVLLCGALGTVTRAQAQAHASPTSEDIGGASEASLSAPDPGRLPDTVAVNLPGCPRAAAQALMPLLEVELSGLGMRRVDEQAALRVTVETCGPDPLALTLSHGDTTTQVSLAVPQGAARARALVVVEAIRERWPELARRELERRRALDAARARDTRIAALSAELHALRVAAESTARDAAAARAQLEAAQAAGERDRERLRDQLRFERERSSPQAPRWSVGAHLVALSFASAASTLFGAGVDSDIALPLPASASPVGLRLRARVSAAGGRQTLAVGAVHFTLVDGALALAPELALGRVRLALGPELSVAWLNARGEANSTEVAANTATAALWRVGATLALRGQAGRVVLEGALSASYLVSGFEGQLDESTITSLSGGVLGVQLGVSLAARDASRSASPPE